MLSLPQICVNMAKFEDRKLVEMVLYILNRTGGTDFYHVFKILYFAEIKHLAKWGRNITPDTFCALDYGPVPSDLYNAVKEQESPHSELARLLKESTTFAGADAPYVMLANRDADTKYLSKSEREMLDASIDENANLTFRQLMTKSHDAAWKNAFENGTGRREISLIEMAMAAGVDDVMLDYIKERLELKAALA